MIEKYSDHAANERTFLAWVRTGIAIIAFGFVVEKFNLFVRSIVEANASDNATRLRLDRFSGSFSHYDGFALILIGMALIALSLVRFIRTGRMIDDRTPPPASRSSSCSPWCWGSSCCRWRSISRCDARPHTVILSSALLFWSSARSTAAFAAKL
jgi:putative membrane protein